MRISGRWVSLLSALVAIALAVTLVFLTSRRGASGPERPLTVADLSPEAQARLDEGPLRIGWFRGAAPVSVWDGDEVAGGYAIEQWSLMAVKFGLDVEHVVFDDIPAVVAALRDGTIDVAGTQGERPDLLEFAGSTAPLAWERITFVGRSEQVALGIGTLAARTVTTVAGSPLEQALLAQFPEATYVPTATIPEGLAAVNAGDIDLYLAPLAVVGFANRQNGLDLLPIGESIQLIPVSAWAGDGTPELEIVRAARSQLTDEEISVLTARWAGFDLGPPIRETTPTGLIVALWVAFGAVVVTATFAWILRRRVAVATADLRELNATLEERVADATQQLRTSNAALKRFGEAVAHDLKSPLAAVFGFAEMLGREDVGEDVRANLAGHVARSAQYMSSVIDGMLVDAVRAGGDDVGEQLTGSAFAQWVHDVSGPELDIIGGHLDVDVPEDLVIAGPVDVLRRATMNLVTNAAKYADNERGTRVRVSVGEVDGDLALHVDDNGPGIAPELRASIFDLGKRLVVDDRGFGLGLAAVRDLVEGAGGSIHVGTSDLGGAAFTVRLPTSRSTTSVQEASEAGPS